MAYGQKTNQPPRYELLHKHGAPVAYFASAVAAADYARKIWPDQEQDEDRTGKGWDIQVAGAE